MNKIILVSLFLIFSISISNGQSTIEENIKPNNKFILKTNPLSPISGVFKLILEQQFTDKVSLEYEIGYRRRNWDSTNGQAHAGFFSIRPKHYFLGAVNKGFYIAPVISYEYINSKTKFDLEWKDKSVFAGFIDIGIQFNIQKISTEFFSGIGYMTDSPNRFIDFGEPYGTHLGFGNQLAYRAGIRVGLSM